MNLITWNIQWGRGADGRLDLDRIVADARRLADFDVLCLQEVSSNYPDLPGNDGMSRRSPSISSSSATTWRSGSRTCRSMPPAVLPIISLCF